MDLLPAQQSKLAGRTSEYEDAIRALWEEYKPLLENGDASPYDFVQEMEKLAGETWPAAVAEILDIDEADLTERQWGVIHNAEAENRNFLMTSLAPDITRALVEGEGVEGVLDSFDHRIIVMYAGALWGLGSTVTVMFDGLSLRDLADLFMFFGPHDEATCVGPRGCAQHANQVYPVAQLLAEEIIPGKMQCYGNCRHFLLPIVSFPEAQKHTPGGVQHDQSRHGYRGGAAPGASGRARRPEYEGSRLVDTRSGSRLSIASYGNINSAKRRLERIPDADKYEVVRGEGRYHVVTKAHTTTTPIGKKGKASYKLGKNISASMAEQQLANLGMTPEDLRDTMRTSNADFRGTLKMDHGKLRLSGDFHDAETGEFLGSASRLYFKRNGQLIAYNSFLAINPDHQGRGLGSDLYDSQLRTLKRVGFDRVELNANGSVGKYAWARKGFNFKQDFVLDDANVRIKRWAVARGYDEPPTFKSAKEMADWGPGPRLTKRNFRITNDAVRDDMVMHVGKAFMLDEAGVGSWDAYLDLKE